MKKLLSVLLLLPIVTLAQYGEPKTDPMLTWVVYPLAALITFFIMRPITVWYFKINEQIALQKELIALKKIELFKSVSKISVRKNGQSVIEEMTFNEFDDIPQEQKQWYNITGAN